MGSTPTRDNLIVMAERERVPAEGLHSTPDDEVLASMGEIAAMVVSDRPLKEMVERTLLNIDRLFGISEMILQVRDEALMPALWWVVYGVPRERAERILRNVTADYHPQELIDLILTENFRVSSSAYFVPAEEWLKILDEDPFAEHPAYYSHPENVRSPRRSPDEWHEADQYRFAIRDPPGNLLATLELDSSVNRKLLGKETIQTIEMFTNLLGVAMERLRDQLAPDSPTSKVSVIPAISPMFVGEGTRRSAWRTSSSVGARFPLSACAIFITKLERACSMAALSSPANRPRIPLPRTACRYC